MFPAFKSPDKSGSPQSQNRSGGDCACRRRSPQYCAIMNAKVIVMPKAAVLDPQGNAVRDAMRHLGMPEVARVRIGKYMEIDIEGENGELESRLHQLCRDLLSNPVIEDYELLRDESGDQRKTPNAQRSTLNAELQKTNTKRKMQRKRKSSE